MLTYSNSIKSATWDSGWPEATRINDGKEKQLLGPHPWSVSGCQSGGVCRVRALAVHHWLSNCLSTTSHQCRMFGFVCPCRILQVSRTILQPSSPSFNLHFVISLDYIPRMRGLMVVSIQVCQYFCAYLHYSISNSETQSLDLLLTHSAHPGNPYVLSPVSRVYAASRTIPFPP